MLVLSRGPEDRICFPTLGVNVEIIRVDGNRVRVGIDAPRDIPVLRHELVGDEKGAGAQQDKSQSTTKPIEKSASHEMRNKLNAANLALNLVERQIAAGQQDKALKTLHMALRAYDKIEEEVAPKAPEDTQHPRALLVEDDDNERQLMAEFMRLSGFEVDTAEDGLQALVYLSRSRAPDVVLMDINMPRFDGVQTINAIRENPDFSAMKVYAVTGEDQNNVGITVGPQGVDGWFQKPCKASELVDHLQSELQLDRESPLAV